MPVRKILFHPLFGNESGSGHLRRCIEWSGRLYPENIAVFKNEGFPFENYTSEGSLYGTDSEKFPEEASGNTSSPLKLHNNGFCNFIIVFDCKSSTRSDILPWVQWATPVLVDDDGPARLTAPFVLDIIPGPRGTAANQSSTSWLELPRKSRNPDPAGNILVSFGGEDPGQITIPLVQSMVHQLDINPNRVYVTLPRGADVQRLPDKVKVIFVPTSLKDNLEDFGLVITAYGITLWEAIGTGCAVITVSPGNYHQFLARRMHIPDIGKVKWGQEPGRREICRLRRLLARPRYLIKKANLLRQKHCLPPKDITRFVSTLEAPCAWCSGCRYRLPPVILRLPLRSYYCCPNCGITGQYRFRQSLGEYDHHYFNQEYTRQYGRNYMEDFEFIKTRAVSRLKHILLHSKYGGRLLDIGCAFGPFLQAAKEQGFRPYGTDISPEAVDYVRNKLGIPAVQGNFPESYMLKYEDNNTYDVITLWYVIEHFPDLGAAIMTINTLLKVNGVLAISTPNSRGISGRLSRKCFLQNSPLDHYTVWSPRSCRKLLGMFRMRVYRIRVTGHHPERFPLGKVKFLIPFLHPLFMIISRIFRLGDTFEAYAVKERDI